MIKASSSPIADNPLSHRPELMLLALVWAVSLLVLASPFADTLLIKAIFLIVPVLLSLLVTSTQPRLGFAIWSFGLALLATQTGFQIDIGVLRTSALEGVGLFLLLALFYIRRRQSSWLPSLAIPGYRIFALFAAYTCAMLLISLVQGVSPFLALFQFKGFLLYPLIGLVLLVGIPSPRALRWLVVAVVLWYLFWGAQGIYLFITETARRGAFVQSSGNYAAINIYGVTLSAVSLFLIGLAEHAPRRGLRVGGHLLAIALFVAATASLSRTTWISFSMGILFLFFLRGVSKRNILLWFLLIALITLNFIPDEALTARVFQLSDSSTQSRFILLASGVQAWKARWLTGWGWGQGFYLVNASAFPNLDLLAMFTVDARASLASSNWIPWHHNDYLNLAVQTGLIGLILYLAFWRRLLAGARRWLGAHLENPLSGYVAGAAAALVGVLSSGLFEHTLWRTDSAGIISLFFGILLVAMHLGEQISPREKA